MTAVTAQTVDIVFRGIDRDYQRTAKRVDRTTDRLRKRFMLVSTAAAGFTVALGAGAANAAKNFQKSMANVAAVTGASREQMKAWNAEVLKIGRNSVAGPQAVAEAFYQVSSGVTDATARMDVLRQSVALAEAGQADLATTTSGLIAAVNAYTPAILSAERASDIYSRTVALGVGSMDEFVSALNPLAGLAASVGLDFAHVGASLSFMTAKGQTASQASTQLKAAITAILKPNQDMAATLQAIGFESGEAALKQVGLAGVLGRLQNEVGGSTDAMAGMLGSVEALQAAVVLNQAGFEDFLGTYLDGIEGATAASRRMQLRSFAAQWSLLQSQIQGVAITIGSRLLPPLTTVGKFVTKSLGWLTDNAGAWLDVALAIGGVTVAVGLATTAFGALGIVLSPVALIMGALAGVAGGLYLAWQHDLGGLRTFTENTFGGIINFIEDTKQRFDNFMALLKGVTPLDERMASATSTVQAGFDVTVVRGDTAEGLSVASGGAFSPTDLLDAAGLTYETAYMLQPGVYRIGSTVEQVLNVDTSIARAAQQYDTAQGPMSFTDALNEAFQIDISPLESSINNISGSINSIDGKTLTSLTTFALIDGNALGIVATNMGDIANHLMGAKDAFADGNLIGGFGELANAANEIPHSIIESALDFPSDIGPLIDGALSDIGFADAFGSAVSGNIDAGAVGENIGRTLVGAVFDGFIFAAGALRTGASGATTSLPATIQDIVQGIGNIDLGGAIGTILNAPGAALGIGADFVGGLFTGISEELQARTGYDLAGELQKTIAAGETILNLGMSFGEQFITGITDAIGLGVEAVGIVIKGLINNIIPDAITFPIGLLGDIANLFSLGMLGLPNEISISLGNPFDIEGMELGGRVNRGTPYIVGEKRPELFVPDSAGRILPQIPYGESMAQEVHHHHETFYVTANTAEEIEKFFRRHGQDPRRWKLTN